MNRQLAGLAAVILVIVAAGMYLTAKDPLGLGYAPSAFSAIAAALITFFWFTPAPRPGTDDTSVDEGQQRRAIASAILVLDLILVGSFAFWREGAPLSEESKLLLSNFTTTVGIVIAFYFGASAYVEGKTRTRSGASTNGGKGSLSQPGTAGDAPPAARP